jgi:EpsI family protein
MAKNKFLTLLISLIVIFSFVSALRYLKPESSFSTDLDTFPMTDAGWIGERDNLDQYLIEALNPDYIVSATFTDTAGYKVQLFFDYFTGASAERGVHSPRNCMPGGGWAIMEKKELSIAINDREIPAGRFIINRGEISQVMDFWYVTRYGETSNDFVFKFYAMLSSLTFQPTDVAFIRIVANNTPEGIKALEAFEMQYVPVIYRYLPFE